MAQNGTEWLRMLQNDPEKNVQKAHNGTEYFKVSYRKRPKGTEWHRMILIDF